MGVRLIQVTNANVPAVAANQLMPLGADRLIYPACCCDDCRYTLLSSNSDTVSVNKPGLYKVVYNASIIPEAAGDVVLDLLVNGQTVYTVTVLGVAGGALNINIPYVVYIPGNCKANINNIPASIQVRNSGVAITSGSSNIVVSL